MKEITTWERGRKCGGGKNALMECPKCHNFLSLSGHTIFETGEVNPSVVCSHPKCDFHEWVVLKGWLDVVHAK